MVGCMVSTFLFCPLGFYLPLMVDSNSTDSFEVLRGRVLYLFSESVKPISTRSSS